MIDDGYTIALQRCETCPPLSEWPRRALILGQCPKCWTPNEKAWRELRARQMVAAIGRRR